MQSSPDVQGFALPDVVNPPDNICFKVNVPNDPGHIKAFLGVLFDLTLWVSWQRDASHTGIQAAQVWKKIWTDLQSGGCEVITFQQPDDCTLQVSHDDGATWTTIYTGLECAIGAADGEITKFLADGILGGPTQPGPGTPPGPSQCWNYHVTVQANAPWKVPIALNDGWIVSVSNVSGATYDGSFTPFWYCPDGGWFLLGACGGSPTTEGTDPLPTADHMALILKAGSVFTAILLGSYTVPPGTGAVDAIFQVNDSVLPDNGGTIEFDLEVCNGNWEHVWGIADLSAWSYSVLDGTGYDGIYVPGVGWTGSNIGIVIALPASCIISNWGLTQTIAHSADFICQGTSPSYANSAAWSATWLFDDTGAATVISRTLPGAPFSPAGGRYLAIAMTGGAGATTVSEIRVGGQGPDPF